MEKEDVMEKIGIEKIRCFNPLGFYACWMVVLWWMFLCLLDGGIVVDDIEYCDMGILSFT